MESKIDNRRIQAREISKTDYSSFESPLRELLEYRKVACQELNKAHIGEGDSLFELIEYTNDLLKKYLKIW